MVILKRAYNVSYNYLSWFFFEIMEQYFARTFGKDVGPKVPSIDQFIPTVFVLSNIPRLII